MSDGNYQQKRQPNFWQKISPIKSTKANYFKAIKLIRGFIRILVGIQFVKYHQFFGDADHFSGSGTNVLQQCRTLPSDAPDVSRQLILIFFAYKFNGLD